VQHETLLFHDYDGNTQDSSEKDHHGTPFGTPGFTDVCLDQALACDGIDDYVSVANTTLLPSISESESMGTTSQCTRIIPLWLPMPNPIRPPVLNGSWYSPNGDKKRERPRAWPGTALKRLSRERLLT
jgi:hypothetical protein